MVSARSALAAARLEDRRALLTLRQAAKALGRHPNTLRNWIKAGYLHQATRPRRGWIFIPQSEVERISRPA